VKTITAPVATEKFDLRAFSTMETLKTLQLMNVHVKHGIAGLYHVPRIKNVTMRLMSDHTKSHIFPVLLKLEKLKIYADCRTKRFMSNLAFCTNLRHLELIGQWYLEDIPDLVQLNKLKTVKLSFSKTTRIVRLPDSVQKITVDDMMDLMSFTFQDPNKMMAVKINSMRCNETMNSSISMTLHTLDMWNHYALNFSHFSVVPIIKLTLRMFYEYENVDFSRIEGVLAFRFFMTKHEVNCIAVAKRIRFPKGVTHVRVVICLRQMTIKVEKLLRIRYPSVEIVCTYELIKI
jgi:hypothetical protein